MTPPVVWTTEMDEELCRLREPPLFTPIGICAERIGVARALVRRRIAELDLPCPTMSTGWFRMSGRPLHASRG